MEAVTNYVPVVGVKVLISGPNSKDYIETEVLWFDDTFILYGKKGFWPNLHKREHVAIMPLNCKHMNITRQDGLDECLDCGTRNY